MALALAIKPSDFHTLYRPSKCALRLYLQQKGIEPVLPGAFEQVLFRLGQRHEKKHLSTFPEFTDLTGKSSERTVDEIQRGSPVIYQGELRHQIQIDGNLVELVGIPDFIIKEGSGYFIRDCKIARHTTEDRHPEIPRQLQIYGWLFEKNTGKRPLKLEVLKGNGSIELIDYGGETEARSHLKELLEVMVLPEEPYSPVGWSKCVSSVSMTRAWHELMNPKQSRSFPMSIRGSPDD